MSKILYSCVLLDEESAKKLKNYFIEKYDFLNSWKWFGHHMTINLGELDTDKKYLLGDKVTLNIEALGISEKACAVKVNGFYTKNKIPHVTLGVNTNNGGKPKDSNDITNWENINVDFKLTGIVSEIPAQEKKNINEISNLNDLPFTNDINKSGGKIYQVGGAVRDKYLGKDSKDLDILITGVPADKLQSILSKYGKVDMVGASFGVIKFKEVGSSEEIDIAIPRTEKKSGEGHKGFDVTADHNLPIEKDLERRDFTINSIGKDAEGNIIDPYGGVNDLNNKIIKVTNPAAFGDDPLRMLRAVQFASRFDFKIEPETFNLIVQNSEKIKEISKERVLIEFEKIVNKGNPSVGAELLNSTGLYKALFDTDFKGSIDDFKFVNTMGEFFYLLTKNNIKEPDEYFKNTMKGDLTIYSEIKALILADNHPKENKLQQAWLYFKINKLSPKMLNSYFIKSKVNDVLIEFRVGIFPKSYKELNINGNDLMNMGFKGKDIGDKLKDAINGVYEKKVANKKEDLINYLKKDLNEIFTITKKELMENIKEEKVIFFDFDGCLMDSPLPETGKEIYAQKTGKPYPHVGWWSKPESLDMTVFDIETNPNVESVYRKEKNDPNTHIVLLTNRLDRLFKQVKAILDHHNLSFEVYSLKNDHREKGDRILSIMRNKYPNIRNIEFYDDDQKHIDNAINVLDGTEYNLKTYKIDNSREFLNQND